MKIDKFKQMIEEKVAQVQQGEVQARKDIAFEILYRIIYRTPVDTGNARSQWNVGLEKNNTAIDNAIDPTGQEAVNRAQVVLDRMKSTDTRIFFTNALPYAWRLETGWSKQAPNGMVQVTLAEFPQLARQKLYVRLGGKGGAISGV